MAHRKPRKDYDTVQAALTNKAKTRPPTGLTAKQEMLFCTAMDAVQFPRGHRSRERKEFRKFVEDWFLCNACPLHKDALHRVLCRGSLPADVAFIGEAPGNDENALGEPFVGRAGKLLNKLIFQTKQRIGREFDYCILNVVNCIPLSRVIDAETGQRHKALRIPTKDEAKACSPHLSQLLSIAQPTVVVYLGKTASNYAQSPADPFAEYHLHLYHPAYMLRNGGEGSTEFKREMLRLTELLREAL